REGVSARLDLDVDAPPGQGIAGTIQNESRDLDSIEVAVWPVAVQFTDRLPYVRSRARGSRGEGAFRFTDLDAGRGRIPATDPRSGMVVASAAAEVKPGRWTNVLLSAVARTLRGRILDRRTRTPLSIRGDLKLVGGERGEGLSSWSFQTGFDGVFVVAGLR